LAGARERQLLAQLVWILGPRLPEPEDGAKPDAW